MSVLIEKIAVIMSVYKNDDLKQLKRAVESILNQDYAKFSLYIYIDGKVPNSITNYISSIKLKSNVFVFKFDWNKGLAHALNYLIDIVVSKGGYKYIARMDSDDISYSSRFTEQVQYFEENPSVDVCGTFCQEVGASYGLNIKALPTLHDDLVDFSITRCPFIHPTVMFRVNVFLSKIRYPVDTTYTEDMALWFLLIEKGYKLGNLNKVLLVYQLNEDTVNRRKGFKKALSEIKLRKKYMRSFKKVSLINVLLVYGRLAFHLLPISVIKIFYARARQ